MEDERSWSGVAAMPASAVLATSTIIFDVLVGLDLEELYRVRTTCSWWWHASHELLQQSSRYVVRLRYAFVPPKGVINSLDRTPAPVTVPYVVAAFAASCEKLLCHTQQLVVVAASAHCEAPSRQARAGRRCASGVLCESRASALHAFLANCAPPTVAARLLPAFHFLLAVMHHGAALRVDSTASTTVGGVVDAVESSTTSCTRAIQRVATTKTHACLVGSVSRLAGVAALGPLRFLTGYAADTPRADANPRMFVLEYDTWMVCIVPRLVDDIMFTERVAS